MNDVTARLDVSMTEFSRRPGVEARRVPRQPPAVYAEWSEEVKGLTAQLPCLAKDAGYVAFLRSYFCAHAESAEQHSVVHVYGMDDDLGDDAIDEGGFFCLAYGEYSPPNDDVGWYTVSFFLPASETIRPGVYRGVYTPDVKVASDVERTWYCDDFLSLLPRLMESPDRWLA